MFCWWLRKKGRTVVLIGDRIRAIRERKQLSQVELAVRAGLVRIYISGVENGYIVPSVETMEKIAQVLEVPLHRLFYDNDEPPLLTNLPNRLTAADIALGVGRKDRDSLMKFSRRPDSRGHPRRSEDLTKMMVISICLSESPSPEAHRWGGYRHGDDNLIQNSSDAANKT
jgi:transcriptional regulator with XRE-family HTH domain